MSLCQCPCCDYFTIEQGNDYEICPVCFWEDDYLGFESLDEPSGANRGLTIRQARDNFSKYGACSREFLANALPAGERVRFRHESRAASL